MRQIFRLEHCKSINWQDKLFHKWSSTKNDLRTAYIDFRGSESCKKRQNWGKMRSKIHLKLNLKSGLKVYVFYFWPPVCPKCVRFSNSHSLYNLSMPCKVHFLYCFVCEIICSVHLWIYSVPNGKLASKLKILYFWPPFWTNLALFAPFLASISYLILSKCSFCILSFAQPFF